MLFSFCSGTGRHRMIVKLLFERLSAAWLVPVLALACGCSHFAGDKPIVAERIVFLGDSITDGFTYPTLVRQAFSEGGVRVPLFINGGVAGDVAAGMRTRISRDVFPYAPDVATVSVGINDVLRGVTLESYEPDVRSILEQLRARDIRTVILTTSVLGPKNAEAEARLTGFNEILRRLATEYDCRVADVNGVMHRRRGQGLSLLEVDDVHPNYAGHRAMARAVLDAFGYPDLAVPAHMQVQQLPGIVCSWRLRACAADEPGLTAATVSNVSGPWLNHELPETVVQSHWWSEQVRQEGFALSFAEAAGKAKRYVGVATVKADRARIVFVNTGGHLETVWLNGERIFKSEGWTGYHAGKERIRAELEPGLNTIVIETGQQFFLSITNAMLW